MLPVPYRVRARHVETHDSVTLELVPTAGSLGTFLPGQFLMLYRHGVGEIAISISGAPGGVPGAFAVTVRDVGAVSAAIAGSAVGDVIGARGPFGEHWGVAEAAGRDLVLVAGGVGLAPLRPVLLAALADRAAFGRIVLVAGARAPQEFLFTDQLAEWRSRDDLELLLTIDRPAVCWTGEVGFVTDPLSRLSLRPGSTTAFVCGPEPMMRFCAHVLVDKGMRPADIRISLERNMKCGVGVCGHCQLGPLMVCRDGPVVDYAGVASLLAVQEL